MGKATAKVTHQGLGEFNKAHRDATFVHQFTRQHKERDRHQWEAVHAVVDVAVQQGDVALLTVHPQQDVGGGEQAKEDGQADHQEDKEDREEPN